MICNVCGIMFTDRNKLLMHLAKCKQKSSDLTSITEKPVFAHLTDEIVVNQITTNSSTEFSIPIAGHEKLNSLNNTDNCIEFKEFIVIGTQCVAVQEDILIETTIQNNAVLFKETDDTSEHLNNQNGEFNNLSTSSNEPCNRGITDPDWTLLNNEEDTDSLHDNNIEHMSRLCETESNVVQETIPEESPTADGGLGTGKKRKRWSKADPTTWSRSVQKKQRNTGQAYIVKGKNFSARLPKQPCDMKCRYKCTQKFSEEERKDFCSKYWSLELYTRKKDFILKHVKCVEPERRRSTLGIRKQRKDSKQYFFFKNSVETRVCQKFFLNTISISNGPVNSAFKNDFSCATMFLDEDKRGKHIPANKLSNEEVGRIKTHIESFPLTESHYCRNRTSRKYLDSKLSIIKMFALYKEQCEERNSKPTSITTYKRIFCNNYNYAFFKPRKDQCALCTKYKLANAESKISIEQEYLDHREREKEANLAKENDKEKASKDPTFVSVTFDMQSVLQVPSTEASPMYYSRKLSCFNLTIYESAPPNNAQCFVWNEINGKRGSVEVGTCLQKFLKGLPATVKEVSLFSDTCGGQNRNQNVVAVLLHTVQTSNIDVIEQKFLESGHSMMQCDSMHSAIESAKKHVAVYTMHDWINIFRAARSKRNRKNAPPYVVHTLQYNDFNDLSSLAKSVLKNKKKDTEGNVVNWLKIKCFRFEKVNPEFVFFRYEFSGAYSKISIFGRGGHRSTVLPELKKIYSNLLPISQEKYNDLNKLCSSGVIPTEFHPWYRSLPFSKKVTNQNPEPSMDSDSDCED